ncbi:MAG: G5 domain-containing protein [Actinomycetota bacterium]
MRPSPARARPHDAGAWFPLPDIDALPTIEELIGAEAATAAPAAAAGRGADVRPLPARPEPPLVRPSPARAEPHDPSTWFPILALEDLLAPDALVDSGQTRAVTITEPVPSIDAPARRPARARPARRTRGAAARQTARTQRRRRALVLALSVATLAAAGATIPRLLTKGAPEVTIRVDGKKLVVSTEADTVRKVLREEKVKLGPDDRVEPALAADVSDGLDVKVLRAFDVIIDFDGNVAAVPTTRTSVAKLQRELNLDPATVAVKSAPDRLGEGAAVVFRTQHAVTVNVDGSSQAETSIGLNVSEVLAENAVVLGPLDRVDPAPETRVTEGMVVTVVRITNDETVTAEEPLAFTVERRDDPNLPKGQERVVQEGVNGIQKVTYQITKADGAEVGRQPISKVPTKPATPKIIMVGTALPNQRVGTASWYASPFGGDSCATKEYIEKGTIVRVTNLDTGASTTCRVADRVVANRVVDLDDDVFAQLAPRSSGVFNARIDW